MDDKNCGVVYVGVNDKTIDLFEGQYAVPNGIAYNSYVIIDEKIAVLDTVDAAYGAEWINNVNKILCGRLPDYLVVLHMEPDHSANVMNFVKQFPSVKIVGNFKTFVMLSEFFGNDFADSRLVVKDGEKLLLGKHELKFIFAPMVHWPEVMVTYDSYEKILFSADAFGKFGSLDVEEDWVDEARRYYYGIVGKYGVQVQSLLNKLGGLQIEKIYPLHGPMLTEKLQYFLNLYVKWSAYTPEVDGVMIAYTSIYGHTKYAAQRLEQALVERGVENIILCDLVRSDFHYCISKAFEYSKLVLATTTYNAGIFPAMKNFLDGLIERNFRNRTVGIIENGSWLPLAGKAIISKLESCKEIVFIQQTVKIRSALNEDSMLQLANLADALAK